MRELLANSQRVAYLISSLTALNFSVPAILCAGGRADLQLPDFAPADIASGDSPQMRKTLPAGNAFSVQQWDGVDWLVRPNGERFFSLGVCVVTSGVSRNQFDPKNP